MTDTTPESADWRNLIEIQDGLIHFRSSNVVVAYALTEVATQLAQHVMTCNCPAVPGCEVLHQAVEAAIENPVWRDNGDQAAPIDLFPVIYECLYWLRGQKQISAGIMLDALTAAARDAGVAAQLADQIRATRDQIRAAVSERIKGAVQETANKMFIPTVITDDTVAEITDRITADADMRLDGPVFGLEDAPQDDEVEEELPGLTDLLASLPGKLGRLKDGGLVVVGVSAYVGDEAPDETPQDVAE